MKPKKHFLYISTFIIGMLTIQACKTYYFRTNYENTNALLHKTKNLQPKPFLKTHLKNGDICILNDTWQIDTVQNLVSGEGTLFDFNRNKTSSGKMSIFVDSVAIFETNTKLLEPENKRIAALSILAGVDAILGLICITNPKACFGSCPTFYINENDNFHYADAEGFSNAITPSMEYFDIDALNNKSCLNGIFSITMKNEALETHCVNDVRLLAYPRKENEHVFQSAINEFYLCENNYSISTANGNEGDITQLIKNDDKQERFSPADENNLSSREEIFLNFDDVKYPNELGLLINFRQTLMTSYLFYSSMGYMGDNVGDVFAKLETNKQIRNKFDAVTKELGNIEVYLYDVDDNKWHLQNNLYETGPIAINRQIIPLQNKALNSNVKIKLVINKGLWRIDYCALTNIKQKVVPTEITANSVLNKGKVDNSALNSINDPEKYLISMPGCEYKFNFVLPETNTDYELFLYTKGYYLEWMREHWLKDKDLLKLKQMIMNPKKYLKLEAKNYKTYETTMEQEFWNSKIDPKIFSYYEN